MHFLGLPWTTILEKLGELWKIDSDESLNEKSAIISLWLENHPEVEDEAIPESIWLDHHAGKIFFTFCPLINCFNIIYIYLNIVKTLSDYWKLPVLIFQTCDDFSGYVCTESVFGDEEVVILDNFSVRKIVSLHTGGSMFNYLIASDFNFGDDVDIAFTATLESICDAMRNNSIGEGNIALQNIVDRSEQFDSLMNSSGIGSSTVSKLTPERNAREDDDDDIEEADDEEDNDDKGVVEDDKGEISHITSVSNSSMEHKECLFDNSISKNYVKRCHVFGTVENNKKYYYNTLR